MKIIAGLIVALAIAAFILVPQLVFVVDETEVAIITRFGELQGVQENPGMNFKTPFVEKVTKYEKRLLIFDAPPQSMLTRDKKRLEIDVYARGKIVNPKLFRETVFTEANAATVAIPIISSSLREEIAKDDQIEIIAVNREEIMNRVRDAVAPQLVPFGIEVVDIRIKRADFPATIADSVYARMQAERKRIADRERAEGAERDAEVRADVDREAAIIRAEAERDAQITRGEGEAESVKIFAEALQQDPEFYAFQRSLQAYRTFLTDGNTTLVLPADSELFQFLQSPTGSNR
jgi:membrane protease subunit HflC